MRRAPTIMALCDADDPDESLNPWQSLASYRHSAKRRRPFRVPRRVRA